jgi:hypothetical protein
MIDTTMAQDFVHRVVLNARTIQLGRGMTNGQWLSPISRDDLSTCAVFTFGQPVGMEEGATRILRFRLEGGLDLAGAAVSTAAGVAALAIFGVGWVSTPGKRVTDFCMSAAESPCSSGFTLSLGDGRSVPPELLGHADTKLLGLEEALVARRILYGWQADVESIMAADDTIVGRDIMARL